MRDDAYGMGGTNTGTAAYFPAATAWCDKCHGHRQVLEESEETAPEYRGQRVYYVTSLACGHSVTRETGEVEPW